MNPDSLSYIGLVIGMLGLIGAVAIRIRRYRRQEASASEGHGVVVFMLALLIFLIIIGLSSILPNTRAAEQVLSLLFVSYLIGLGLWGCWVLLETGIAVLHTFRQDGLVRGVLNSVGFAIVVVMLAVLALTLATVPHLGSITKWPWPAWLKILSILLGSVSAVAAAWYSRARKA